MRSVALSDTAINAKDYTALLLLERDHPHLFDGESTAADRHEIIYEQLTTFNEAWTEHRELLLRAWNSIRHEFIQFRGEFDHDAPAAVRKHLNRPYTRDNTVMSCSLLAFGTQGDERVHVAASATLAEAAREFLLEQDVNETA